MNEQEQTTNDDDLGLGDPHPITYTETTGARILGGITLALGLVAYEVIELRRRFAR